MSSPKSFNEEICKGHGCSLKQVRNALHKKGRQQEKDVASTRVTIDGVQNRYIILTVNNETVEQNFTKNDIN